MSVPTPILQYSLSDASVKGLLPSGYTPLAYIECNGSLLINTGVGINNNIKISAKWGNLSWTSGGYNLLYGANSGANTLTAWCAESGYNWRWGGIAPSVLPNWKVQDINYTEQSKDGIRINGVLVSTYSGTPSFNNQTIYLFGDTGSSYYLTGRCYYLNILNNNNLVADLRPARRDSDGVIGMYDLVSRTFKINSGSGAFIAGPELAIGKNGGKSLPEEYLLVEYLQMAPGLYINTGQAVAVNDVTKTEAWMWYASGSTRDLMGWSTAAAEYWGCTAGSAWEKVTGVSPITQRQKVTYDYTATTAGTYQIGALTGGYSTRTKYIELVKITIGGSLKRNLYACYRKSDMKPGMYDTVTGTFYTNLGSGEFILGPSITNCYTSEPNAGSGTLLGFYTNLSGIYDSSKGWVADFSISSVEMPGLLTLLGTSTSFSFAVWFKRSSGGGWNTIWGCSGFELEGSRSGAATSQIVAYSWGQSSSGGIEYTLNEWHHLVMTRNTSESKFYLDGELKYTGSAGSIPNTALFLGAWKQHGSQSYLGQMTNMMLFNTVLTAAQVKELYGK